jgi:GH24 family phage-related lysozyme (muramidase)
VRDVVREAFHAFSEPLEGRCRHLYADAKGLITTGVGNLVDPVNLALALPWRRPDGELATDAEVIAAWKRVKRDANPRAGGGTHARLTSIRLEDADVDRLIERKLDEVDAQLARLLPAWESWPADGELALISWAWAAGAAAKYPKMLAALKRLDFAAAADEVKVWSIANDGTKSEPGTLKDRNRHNRNLLRNAAAVVVGDLDPTVLHWPAVLLPEDEAA